MPWQPDGGHDAAEAVKVEDMMLLVDTLLEDTSTDSEKVEQHCTPHSYFCYHNSRLSFRFFFFFLMSIVVECKSEY